MLKYVYFALSFILINNLSFAVESRQLGEVSWDQLSSILDKTLEKTKGSQEVTFENVAFDRELFMELYYGINGDLNSN